MASMIRSGWRAGMAWSLASATMSSADAVWLAYSVWGLAPQVGDAWVAVDDPGDDRGERRICQRGCAGELSLCERRGAQFGGDWFGGAGDLVGGGDRAGVGAELVDAALGEGVVAGVDEDEPCNLVGVGSLSP